MYFSGLFSIFHIIPLSALRERELGRSEIKIDMPANIHG